MGKGNQPPTTERRKVEVEVDCDVQVLYGPLQAAADYLTAVLRAHPGLDIRLDEKWTGYEDMYMRFVYERDETDEEYADRQEREQLEAADREIKRLADESKEKRRAQYESLPMEFGR